MSLNTTALYMRVEDWPALRRAVLAYARDWHQRVFAALSQQQREDAGWLYFLDARQRRRFVLLPPMDGWAALVEAFRYRADGELARFLSMRFEGPILRVEVNGGYYSWCAFTYQDGCVTEGRLAPSEVFEDEYLALLREAHPGGYAVGGLRGAMPIYRDAEQDAFEYLDSRGVPHGYRLTPFPFFFDGESGQPARGLVATIDARGVDWTEQELCVDPRPYASPPLVCDIWSMDAGGARGHIREVRCLAGEPHADAVAALVDLEQRFHRRALEALNQPQESAAYHPEIAFEYLCDHAAELDEQLNAERARRRTGTMWRARRAPLLTQAEFGRQVARLLGEAFPRLAASLDEPCNALLVTIAQEGAQPAQFPLDNLYQRYVLDPCLYPDRVLDYFAAVLPLAEQPPRLPSYTDARRALLPALVNPWAGPPFDSIAERAVVDGLSVVLRLALESSAGLAAYVTTEMLAAWEVEFDQALAVALENLAAAGGDLRTGLLLVRPGTHPDKRLLRSAFADAHSAPRVLLPGFYECATRLLGARIVVGIPRRDRFYAASADDADLPALLRARVEEEYREGPYPLSPQLYVARPGGLEPWL